MTYRISGTADADIVRLYAEGVSQFGLVQTDRYHDALFDVFELLAANPKMARERVEFTMSCRIHRFQSHVIIYQIEGDDIRIIRVRHGREDWFSDPT